MNHMDNDQASITCYQKGLLCIWTMEQVNILEIVDLMPQLEIR